jgi:hypothetical protein
MDHHNYNGQKRGLTSLVMPPLHGLRFLRRAISRELAVMEVSRGLVVMDGGRSVVVVEIVMIGKAGQL